ncbi:MAG TPA: GEVED domain-containing protein [Bacteroidales bacterium]|nr:GEVED domain-containing protein [Bacteroidales bacterium]
MRTSFYALIAGIAMMTGIPAMLHSQVETRANDLRNFSMLRAVEMQAQKAYALDFATRNGIPLVMEAEGRFLELMFIDEQGQPQYYSTENAVAAATISTNKLYPTANLGLSIDGAGITVHEWDGGAVRTTHQELAGRVVMGDGVTTTHPHSTHVAGTLIASGVVASAKGMAPAASLRAFDWNSDEAEMASEAANQNALVSNHSYGYVRGWYYNGSTWTWYGNTSISSLEDYLFGFYDSQARNWDQIAYNAPYYLITKSAGNDRNEGPTGGAYPKDGPYDCIAHAGVAKNILTVGAVYDIPNGYTQPGDVVMSDFSCWGPADDGRIKPDIVANGISLYSSLNGSDAQYGYYSGTSMASPSAAGSMILLQKHHHSLTGQYMLASTLKALVIHTADEAGTAPGPDYQNGWGLMNTYKAAQKISEDQANNVIDELVLANGGTYQRTVTTDGTHPLVVTIVWTDPAGTPVSAVLDPSNPMLVNDLDLRVSGGANTFYPWKLSAASPTAAATNAGENNTDNVEQVFIANAPAGTYTITVDHDGSLTNGSQAFSIVISGILISTPPPPALPVAAFTANPTNLTAGGSVSFTDQSQNGPTSWSWSFPGGSPSSSASQNPVVTYATAGSYDVRLVVSNSAGSDTLFQSGYITVDPYIPVYCGSHGNAVEEWIQTTTFGGVPTVSGSSGTTGYQDLSATALAVEAGISLSLSLQPGFTGASKFEYWRIWIDYNGDQDFSDAGELVFSSDKKKTTVTGSISIPSGLNLSTRMRVAMKRGSAPSPCEVFAQGEAEDYSLAIAPPVPVPPTANFTASTTTVVAGGSVNFTDLSSGDPTSWSWSFSGGNPSTSTAQNPGVVYSTPGTYDVVLSVSNAQGSDTETRIAYITVDAAPPPSAYCEPIGINNVYYISSVKIGNTTSSTGKGSSGYTYYPAPVFSLSPGQTVSVTLTPSNTYSRFYWKVWIDANGDGDFDDPDETLLTQNNKKGSFTASITIPSAAIGSTRLRVAMRYGGTPTPCLNSFNGEMEDYDVSLSGATMLNALERLPELLLKVYPNPAREAVNLWISSPEDELIVRVTNARGQLIDQFRTEPGTTTLNTSGYAPGLYFLQLSDGQRSTRQVLMKQ